MNLSCDNKILQDVRLLIHDVVLPRLDRLEEEMRELRRVTWPVCQSLREKSQLTDIRNKKRFLSILDEEEVKVLLREKASVSTRPIEYSTAALSLDEWSELNRSDHSEP
jgi:hypothetical protein